MSNLYDLATGPTDRVRRSGAFHAPDTNGPADAADAAALVRHLIAQRSDDARRSGFLGAATHGASATIAAHHDASGAIR